MEIKRYSKNLYKIFDDYAEIYIHNYKTKELLGTIKVDLEDLEEMRNYKWCLSTSKYARARDIKNNKIVFMHHLLMPIKEGELIDHINEDKLDNRKSNLRKASKSLNGYNNSKARKDSKTGVRGVTKHNGRYRANIRINGKQKFLGYYDTIEKAQEIYESYRREMIE